MDSKARAKKPVESKKPAPVAATDSKKKDMPPVREGARRMPPSIAPKPPARRNEAELKAELKEPEPGAKTEDAAVTKPVPDAKDSDAGSIGDKGEDSVGVEGEEEGQKVVVPDLATELLYVGADHEVLEDLRGKIRRAIAEVRKSEYRKEAAELVEENIAALSQLLEEFKHVADVPFHFQLPDLLKDIISEFYFVMEHHREKETLGIFYDDSVALTLPETKPINTVAKATNAWLDAFNGLQVVYTINKIEIDVPERTDEGPMAPATGPPKRYDAFVTVTARLKVDSDSPRKVMELLEVRRAPDAPPSPVHTLSEASELLQMNTLYPRYRIIRHVLVVQDARPLYCFPFRGIPRTKFDNWEEKFRPDDWEEIQSVASTVTKVSKAPTIKDDPTRGGDESALDEDDDGSSIVSGGPSIASAGTADSAAQAKKEAALAALMRK